MVDILHMPMWQMPNEAFTGYLSGGVLYFYETGTTSEKTVWQDAAKSTAWTQPVSIGASGRPTGDASIYGEGRYKVVAKTSASGSTLWTVDPLGPRIGAVATDLSENVVSNSSFEVTGTGTALANWTLTQTGGSIEQDVADSIHGIASIKLSGSGSAVYADSAIFEHAETRMLQLAFWVKADAAAATPQVKVLWLDKDQGSVSNSTIYRDDDSLSPTDWTYKEGFGVSAPSTTRYARLRVFGNTDGTARVVRYDGMYARSVSRFQGVAPSVPFGLKISADAGDTAHDINVTAGAVKDENNEHDMILSGEITKQMDAAFAEGDDAGGMESGGSLPTSGVLYIWLIKNPTTGRVEVLGSASATSPTMPSGYTLKRYLLGVQTDSSDNIMTFKADGDEYTVLADLEAQVEDTTVTDASLETAAVNAPPESYVRFFVRCEHTSAGAVTETFVFIRPADASWATTKFGTGMESASDDIDEIWAEIHDVRVDSSSQIDYGADWVSHTTTGDTNIDIYIKGWRDQRRNNP